MKLLGKLDKPGPKLLIGIVAASIYVYVLVTQGEMTLSSNTDIFGAVVAFIYIMGLPWGFFKSAGWNLEVLLRIPFVGLMAYVAVRAFVCGVIGIPVMIYEGIKSLNPYR